MIIIMAVMTITVCNFSWRLKEWGKSDIVIRGYQLTPWRLSTWGAFCLQQNSQNTTKISTWVINQSGKRPYTSGDRSLAFFAILCKVSPFLSRLPGPETAVLRELISDYVYQIKSTFFGFWHLPSDFIIVKADTWWEIPYFKSRFKVHTILLDLIYAFLSDYRSFCF